MTIKIDDLNTWGIFASIAGLIISIITLIIAESVRKATKRLQDSLAFDKRVPGHLKQIGSLLSDFNILLNNVNENINQIKAILAHLKSELISLSLKITDKRTKKIIRIAVYRINKNLKRRFVKESHKSNNFIANFYKVSEDDYWNTYTDVGEIHRTIDNLYKDKKAQIKP